MKLEIVPNTTEVVEIIASYTTTLKIDNNHESIISITETLTDLNDDQKARIDLKIDIQTYPENVNSSNVIEYVTNVEEFIKENLHKILAETKS